MFIPHMKDRKSYKVSCVKAKTGDFRIRNGMPTSVLSQPIISPYDTCMKIKQPSDYKPPALVSSTFSYYTLMDPY